jgi:hypothetical protein
MLLRLDVTFYFPYLINLGQLLGETVNNDPSGLGQRDFSDYHCLVDVRYLGYRVTQLTGSKNVLLRKFQNIPGRLRGGIEQIYACISELSAWSVFKSSMDV